MRRKMVPVHTVLLVVAGALAAWGGAPAPGGASAGLAGRATTGASFGGTSKVGAVGPSGIEGGKPSGGGFPVSVTSAGATVRIDARPTRILSLSASATQMLYTIGAGPQVVGVDKYSTYPRRAPRTQFTGDESSAEDYLRLHPDLVILAFDPHHLVAQLETLHIPALLLPTAASVKDAYRQIRELGAATGHRAGAAREVTSVKGSLARISGSVRGRARGKTYYIELDPTLYTMTSKTWVGGLFGRLGMRDVADPAAHGSISPQLSAEYLVKANPDYVFLADTLCCAQTVSTFAHRPGFEALRAVRSHHVVAVNDSLASEWGPHSMETFLQVVAHAVAGGNRTR